jgi:hypothetical protein
MFTKIIEECL